MAAKRIVPLTSVMYDGEESFGTNAGSRIEYVPAGVPSERQSRDGVFHKPNTAAPGIEAESCADGASLPGSTVVTSVVPAGVPSLRQSSRPPTPRSTQRRRAPGIVAAVEREKETSKSRTRIVPPSVPSVAQSCEPLALKRRVPEETSGPLPGWEWTRTVPASVPSLFQIGPSEPSLKKSAPA